MSPAERARAACNRLAKWRSWYAGWALGTRSLTGAGSGPVRAARDAAERSLLLRAELTALAEVLVTAGVITREQLWEALAREADFLSEGLSQRFPGVTATDTGLTVDRRAVDTMAREGFPP